DIDLCLQHNQDYNVSFNGSRSVDEDSDSLTYRWDFGDGSGDDGANVTHVYQNKGAYVATLFVDDESGTACSSSSDTVNINLNKAPVAVAGDDVRVCQGTPVTFDGSGSISEAGEELQYEWDLGDGTSLSGVNVTHNYAKGGNYKVVLTVSDGQGTNCSTSIDSLFVTVNTRPTAVLNAVKIACTGDQISFDTLGTDDLDGDDLTYTWDFGDGTSGEGSNVTHAYSKGGNYSVGLTVDDNKGSVCSSDMAGINVRINTPPVADAGPNLVCCLETVSEFDGSKSFDADGDNLTYSWNFGDGNTGEGAQVTHVYSTIGKFIVTLTVNDNSGTRCDTATDSFTAVVNATPTSVIKIR
ncbi:MAG: PKD domain-containing protein, partial [Candidatus Brocadiaceae bacterium]|nr:PKD domain-containing protein [Candidatus Brocadiaceae bacterium]